MLFENIFDDLSIKCMSCISENEISYALTCQRLKELKDLNEEGPKIAQRLFEVVKFSFRYIDVSL